METDDSIEFECIPDLTGCNARANSNRVAVRRANGAHYMRSLALVWWKHHSRRLPINDPSAHLLMISLRGAIGVLPGCSIRSCFCFRSAMRCGIYVIHCECGLFV